MMVWRGVFSFQEDFCGIRPMDFGAGQMNFFFYILLLIFAFSLAMY
jgi:hypothetical protein